MSRTRSGTKTARSTTTKVTNPKKTATNARLAISTVPVLSNCAELSPTAAHSPQETSSALPCCIPHRACESAPTHSYPPPSAISPSATTHTTPDIPSPSDTVPGNPGSHSHG